MGAAYPVRRLRAAPMIGYAHGAVKRFSDMYIVSARVAGQRIGHFGHPRRTLADVKINYLGSGTNFAYSRANFADIVSADFSGRIVV